MRSLAIAALSLVLLSGHISVAESSLPPHSPLAKVQSSKQPQYPLSSPLGNQHGKDVEALAETIVSTLSASTQHTILLHLLQRSRCIPMLAHLGNGTLFAPTDDAWNVWVDSNQPDGDELAEGWLGPGGLKEWMMDEGEVLSLRMKGRGDEMGERLRIENQNWALRQHLLYHMLNYTLGPDSFVASAAPNVTTLTTLHYPLAQKPDLPPVPEPGPPWLPRGGEGMLGGHGQRLRLSRAGSEEGGQRGKIGVDWLGRGGAAIWNGSGWPKDTDRNVTGLYRARKVQGARWTKNGAVVGLDAVLVPPRSIDSIIRSDPSLSFLSKLLPADASLPEPLPDSLSSTPHLTIFAPSNKAFSAFDDVERRFLEGDFGAESVGRVLGSSVVLGVGSGEVGWRDYWTRSSSEVQAATGEDLVVEASPDGGLVVNGTKTDAVDIFASNGVIHILPNLLLPENFTLLNSAEKVLLSLNATRFVSLLRSANLTNTYVGEPGSTGDEPWTFLAPTDDVLDRLDRWRGLGGPPLPKVDLAEDPAGPAMAQELMPIKDVSPLAGLMQYHIIPGRLLPSDLQDGMLIGTELRTAGLDGRRQRLRVEIADLLGRSQTDWENLGEGEIRFGGASVLGKPGESRRISALKSGKSVIYLVSNLLAPPDDAVQVALSRLQLSTFIASVYAAGMDKIVKRTPATTLFIPRNRAFASLGLTMNYLLSEGKDELRKVLKYHAVDGIVYMQDIEGGKQVLNTLEGGEITLNRVNDTISLTSPTRWEGHDSVETLPSNGELRPAKIVTGDALTSTGVIHEVDSVVIPADVTITIGKLIRGSKTSTMAELMLRAGLAWILDGREPSTDELHRSQLVGVVRTWENHTEEAPDFDSLAMPSYTVLCPTDKAFSRLNLTRYLHDEDALIDLLKLHIIPTQSSIPKTDQSKTPAAPPRDGYPLSLEDDLVYSTLLSSTSKYGEVAFRATGDNSYLVGVRNARSGSGSEAARLGSSGRATVRWRKRRSSFSSKMQTLGSNDDAAQLWRGGMTLGGGVIMLDAVLVPYQPSWFSEWGWLVIILAGTGLVVVVGAVTFGWYWMTRRKKEEGYEPVEEGGDEEEE